ncbi:hypothetical protein HPP92_000128 [Vanilla planifolia]|uniref:Pectinesterase n=1 Tax=Vanilla planifolia TaxID=51239 RepID=A0A835S514_VANPL|nr:hypothetical protein HPP92_000128 [Vanilla planifolia]
MAVPKGAIIGGSVILLVAIVAAVGVIVTHKGPSTSNDSASHGELRAGSKSVEAICQATDYQDVCVSSLSKSANGTTDPRELVKLSFEVASDHIREAFAQSEVLSKAAADPRTKEALETCRELMTYAIDDIKTSFDQLGGFDMTNYAKAVDELKLWLSAAATYQETCLDGFENTTGDAAGGMRRALNASMALTDNALAIVGQLGTLLGKLKLPDVFARRLLSDVEVNDFPSWVGAERRRLLSLPPSMIQPDVVVAQDGSGDFSTINAALAVAPIKSAKSFVVYVKNGVYKEKVIVFRNMTNIILVGDGATTTKITGSLNFIDGVGTFKTATFGNPHG